MSHQHEVGAVNCGCGWHPSCVDQGDTGTNDRVRIEAAKTAVTASEKTGRPVDPRVAEIAPMSEPLDPKFWGPEPTWWRVVWSHVVAVFTKPPPSDDSRRSHE